MNEPTAGGGGSASQPDLDVTGARPAADDAASILPPGVVLPEGYTLVHTPPPTLEQAADGAREHATMERGMYAGALARLAEVLAQAEARVASAEAGAAEARGKALAAHDRACEAEIAAGRDPAPWAEPGGDDGGQAGEG